MNDRTTIIAAMIIGGAIIVAPFQVRSRYVLSAVSNNVAWRMDTWSGQIDICAAAYLPSGPLVRCGATVVVPDRNAPQPGDSKPNDGVPDDAPQPFIPPAGSPRDHA